MREKSFSDIQPKTWFDTLFPKWVYAYARLARWDRPVGIWLLFLPCLWGMFFALPVHQTSFANIAIYTGLFFIGAIAMRGAGCTVNDLWDRKMDARVERTQNRPLASGQINTLQALAFIGAQCFIGAWVLFQFNVTVIFVGLLSLPLIILYPLMKRWTWWPQAFLGITFNWGILLGGAAITGGVSLSLLWLYLGAIFWTIAYDTIYAFQDIEDDTMIGVRSTARLFGDKTKQYLTGFYIAMGLCFLKAGGDMIYNTMVCIIIGGHIAHLFYYWKMDSQHSSLQAFKHHIYFGISVLGMFILRFLLTV